MPPRPMTSPSSYLAFSLLPFSALIHSSLARRSRNRNPCPRRIPLQTLLDGKTRGFYHMPVGKKRVDPAGRLRESVTQATDPISFAPLGPHCFQSPAWQNPAVFLEIESR